MPRKLISYPIRQSAEVFRQIDVTASRAGFATRSKFMVHAALNYGVPDDDALVTEIARISCVLHQVR